MKEVIVLFAITALFFFMFLYRLLRGLRSRSGKDIASALLVLLAAAICGSFGVYSLLSRSYRKVSEAVRPRNGEEIYADLFGKSPGGCVSVLHYRDAVLPVVDHDIYLEFKTCPAELARVSAQRPYRHESYPSSDTAHSAYTEGPDWFRPQSLKDTVHILRYYEENKGNDYYLAYSRDSTHAFFRFLFN